MTAIAGAGTAEADWQRWPALHGFPPLSLTGITRVVLVAPHPDDEILGAGGLLATLAARDVEARVLAVTDGDASHPGSPTLGPAELAARRRHESARALHRLGLGPARVTRLGIADGGVAAAEPVLAAALADLLEWADAGTLCLTTWDGDGHPDHEAAGRVAGSVCSARGIRLVQYPIWAWHWSHPHDPTVPWSRARSVPLDPAVHAAKLAAVECFRTQVHPLSPDPVDAAILSRAALDRLTRPVEVVFE